MVTVVVVINLALALMLFYVAWRVWQLRLRLERWADKIAAFERKLNTVLPKAPEAISAGRLTIHQLRQSNKPLDVKLLRVQQILALLNIGQQIWQQSRLVRQSKFFQKPLAKYK